MNRSRSRSRRQHCGTPAGIALFLLPGLGLYTLLMLYPNVILPLQRYVVKGATAGSLAGV